MAFGIYDASATFARRPSSLRCTDCGEAMSPGDETLCDDCREKADEINDPTLEALAEVIRRRMWQAFQIKIDLTTDAEARERARGAEQMAHAILLDLIQISKEDRS